MGKRNVLYLALSCFQGRPMGEAARTLVELAPGKVGLQLTPGCAPSPWSRYGCFTTCMSVTRSAAAISASDAFRPVTTM